MELQSFADFGQPEVSHPLHIGLGFIACSFGTAGACLGDGGVNDLLVSGGGGVRREYALDAGTGCT